MKNQLTHVKNWLELHGITYNNYVSVIDGFMKAELDYDVFIDDSPLNVLNFLKNKKMALVYSQPWNHDLPDPAMHQISNLSEAIKILKS